MSENFDDELVFFRQLTPDELLQTQNQTIVLTPQEKFARVLKKYDKQARRSRKFHFVAIATTHELFVFDGEGKEICNVENSVKGCRTAREICLDLFLNNPNQNGGYSFTAPSFENLTEEEFEQTILTTYKHLEFHAFTQAEYLNGEYEQEKKNFCYDCETQFADRIKLSQHLCTENWIVKEFFPIKQRQYYYREI